MRQSVQPTTVTTVQPTPRATTGNPSANGNGRKLNRPSANRPPKKTRL
jgi:hypothetical protein